MFAQCKGQVTVQKRIKPQESEASSKFILTLRAMSTQSHLHSSVTPLWHLTFGVPSSALYRSDTNAVRVSNSINVSPITRSQTSLPAPLPLVCMIFLIQNAIDKTGTILLLLTHCWVPWWRTWNSTLYSEVIHQAQKEHSFTWLSGKKSDNLTFLIILGFCQHWFKKALSIHKWTTLLNFTT